jgi:hypothetical protein
MATNIDLFDRFSICHAAGGVVAGSVGMGLMPLLVYHTIFEILENYVLKKQFAQVFPDSSTDSKLNMIGDTIAVVIGWSTNLKDRVKDDPYYGNWTPAMIWKGWSSTDSK